MHAAIRRCLFPAILILSAAAPQAASSQASAPVPDRLAQAREELRQAEAAHPGNSKEVVEAMDKLTNEELDEEKVTPETLERAQREVPMALAAAGDHTEMYADSMVTCALVMERMGRPADARPLVEHAFAIVQKDIPEDYGAYTEAANALASVCFSLGDMTCSLNAYTAAIAVAEKAGAGHELDLAAAYSGRASVRDLTHDVPGGGADLEAALDAAHRGKLDDLNMGSLESNVAVHYSKTGEFDKAIVHTNAALELIRRSYGPDSPLVATIQGNLGDLYTRTGQFPLAYKYFDIALKSPHESIEWQAWNHAGYARALAGGGELRRSLDEGLLSARMARENFVLQARTLPERQALDYSRHRANGLAAALSVLAKHPELPNEAVYQEVVRSRALVAEEMARRQKNLNQSNDAEVARELEELDKARADLLKLGSAGSDKAGANDAVAEATARMEKAERALAERSVAVRNDVRTTAVRLEDLRANLPPGSALVSYVVYQRFAVQAVDPERKQTPSCIAFVLRPGSTRIRVFDLGEVKPIEDLVSRMRSSADAEARGGGMGSNRNERQYREAGLALRQRIWDPLEGALSDSKLVLIVPDGVLNLVPFSALPKGNGYLVQQARVLHMLTSERDLVMPGTTRRRHGLLALGGPAFDLAVNQPAAPTSVALRGAPIACDEFTKIEFGPLPGSLREVTEISTDWRRWSAPEDALLLTGENATRQRFLEESARNRVLHVATHAFVLDRSCGNGNPLLHSGLVFAGANRSRQDAILTAQQIASLDLDGVDWAVLSACNTGNGELRDGEGVLGLQRAFRVAGARSVVMTLWPVDDETTRRFMRALYRQRFAHRDLTAQAAWTAARTLLAERRAAGQSTHPWYWAGFVAAGDWR